MGSFGITWEAQPGAQRPRGVGWGRWREGPEGGDTCILMADSHCCVAETNMTL